MKKLKLLASIIVLFLTLGLNAQATPEKKAKKIADEMTKVLSLNEEDSNAIYQIQLDRFKENQAIEEEYADDPDTKKEKLKELGSKVYTQSKKVLGAERQNQWKEYKSKK